MSRLHQILGLSLLLSLFAAHAAYAQQTVFDVPSADVLDKGKVYGELDGTAQSADPYLPTLLASLSESGIRWKPV